MNPETMSKANVIILTSGLTGSSVLTGLISRAGHWTGESTFKKEYDTYENETLIQLNQRLFEAAGYTEQYTQEFSANAVQRIKALREIVDNRPFREFVATCEVHRPWVWKDPRLWLTIGFWDDLLPDNCSFIVHTRDLLNLWISSTLRRQIRSYRSLRRYEQSVNNMIMEHLAQSGRPYLEMNYEKLLMHPAESIRRLNAHIGTNLSVEDLSAVYNAPLHKAPHSSPFDLGKAALIYLKNYFERVDVEERKRW